MHHSDLVVVLQTLHLGALLAKRGCVLLSVTSPTLSGGLLCVKQDLQLCPAGFLRLHILPKLVHQARLSEELLARLQWIDTVAANRRK